MIGDRWGVTDAETARRYPCDAFVADPALEVWRGVTTAVSPSALWPWVAQIRLGPYSYDWLDNLGRRSPQTLRGLPDPVAGEPFTTAMRGLSLGRIVEVVPGEHLTAAISGTYMSYVLVPLAAERTRLLLKLVFDGPRVLAPLLSVGDLVMARRQLLNLRELAEGRG